MYLCNSQIRSKDHYKHVNFNVCRTKNQKPRKCAGTMKGLSTIDVDNWLHHAWHQCVRTSTYHRLFAFPET